MTRLAEHHQLFTIFVLLMESSVITSIDFTVVMIRHFMTTNCDNKAITSVFGKPICEKNFQILGGSQHLKSNSKLGVYLYISNN